VTSGLRRAAAPGTAVLIIAVLGLLSASPAPEDAERRRVAGAFGFAVSELNDDPEGGRSSRQVQPALRHIQHWISAVGAAVALADLDGDGVDDERCLVDPRDDSVTLAALPGMGSQDPELALRPRGLPWDATMAPTGCVPVDVDQDGDLDVVVSYWGRSPVVFLRVADAGGERAYRPTELVTPMQVWNTTTVNVVDVDGDGAHDLLVGNYFPDGARVLDPTADDSWMRMQDSMSRARNAGVNRLLLLRPTGVPDALPEVVDRTDALPAHSARSWTLATGAHDLDGDGLPELYIANDFGPDQLLLNRTRQGTLRFEEARGARDWVSPKSTVLGRDSYKGMGVAFTYLDEDPLPSIAVSNITSEFALQESNFLFTPEGRVGGPEAPYRNRSEALGLSRSGWSWDIKAADFDNSGSDELVQAAGFLAGDTHRWPELQELAMSNDTLLQYPFAWPRFGPGDDLSGQDHNRFWVRFPGGRFHDVAADLGLAAPQVSRAIATGDVDRDGRLDFVLANQWRRSAFFRSTGEPVGQALSLRLRRPAPAGRGTVAAIGAAVAVELPDGRVRRAQLYPANGHTGVSAADLHVGLGPVGSHGPLAVEVTWRDGAGQHRQHLRLRPGHHEVVLAADDERSTR